MAQTVKRLFNILLWIAVSTNMSIGDELDSLEQILENTINRKRKVDILNRFNSAYQLNDPRFNLSRFRSAISLAEDIKYRDGIALAHENLAGYFFQNHMMDSAILHYEAALSIYREQTDDSKTGTMLYNLGALYFASSKYVEALEYTQESLEMFQITGDMPNTASAHSLLCDIFFNSGFSGDAIEHCLSALNLYSELESLEGQSALLNSIGEIYLELDQYDKSISYFNQAQYIAELDQNPSMLSMVLRNLGRFHMQTEQYEEALENLTSALELARDEGDIDRLGYLYMDIGIALTQIGEDETALDNLQEALFYADSSLNLELKARIYSELGSYYAQTEKYDIAIVFLKQSLFEALKIGADPILQRCYRNISQFYDRLSDNENALRYYKLYISHKDSLFEHQAALQIAEAEAMYNLQEKEKQIEFLRNENRLKEIEAGEKNMINIWLISVLIFVFIVTLILYRQYRLQNKVNKLLNEQKDAINRQKLEIEQQKESIEKANSILAEKNRQITDSLEYAKRIQLSLLPDEQLLKERFKDVFIWYLPRDIVGGDFYWFTEMPGAFCIIAMDCSGHGVPGAFMTVLANTLLNRYALETGNKNEPDVLLKFLDDNIKKELNQQGIQLSALEGIDLAVCIIEKGSNILKFAGAKMPLYHYSNDRLIHIKGNRFSVGGGINSIKKFNVTSVKLKKGDVIYLSSDGFQDQFGGKQGKKFMKLHFKDLLQSMAKLPMDEQKNKLQSVFHEWKDFNTQTDDILVIGMKI